MAAGSEKKEPIKVPPEFWSTWSCNLQTSLVKPRVLHSSVQKPFDSNGEKPVRFGPASRPANWSLRGTTEVDQFVDAFFGETARAVDGRSPEWNMGKIENYAPRPYGRPHVGHVEWTWNGRVAPDARSVFVWVFAHSDACVQAVFSICDAGSARMEPWAVLWFFHGLDPKEPVFY